MDQAPSVRDCDALDARCRSNNRSNAAASLQNVSTGVQHSNQRKRDAHRRSRPVGVAPTWWFRDVREKKRMQQQASSRPLASLGRVATGTPQLNNPLTVVVTNAGFLGRKLGQLQSRAGEFDARHDRKEFSPDPGALWTCRRGEPDGGIVADLRGFAPR
jgi:hypothetical protein